MYPGRSKSVEKSAIGDIIEKGEKMLHQKKIVVVMPAYNASKTL